MKLIRAVFENFRLLRDIELNFSTDTKRKLTVVRAENATGKTTILNALQWALYGDKALPEKGRDYPLYPIDWDISEKRRIPISVQVEFETMSFRKNQKGNQIKTQKRYRIVRSAYETLDDVGHNRMPSTVKLFELTDTGADPIEPPEAVIHDILPPALREVFFTDGDRALSFIEAESVTAKRNHVQEAIRSLLGLDVIKEALRHVKKTSTELNKTAKQIGGDEELTKVTAKIEQVDDDISDLEQKKKDADLQFAALDLKCSELDKDIEAALIKGDREELSRDLKQIESQLKQIDNQQDEASKKHSRLFESLSLSRDLLAPVLEKSLGKLNELHSQGKLPSTTIPVLEECLTDTICICGESLNPDNSDDTHRVDHIRRLIEESRNADAFQKNLTDLYYGSRSLQLTEIVDNELWVTKCTKVMQHRDELKTLRDELGEKLKALEIQLDNTSSIDIQGLRTTRQNHIQQRDQFHADRTKYETQLETLKENRRSLVASYKNLRTKQRRGIRTFTRLEVTYDIQQILENSYDQIVNQELVKVSNLMNTTFLEMIREYQKDQTNWKEQEQESIIQKAEISPDFDILVHGPNKQKLDPVKGLNGASQRALTLAFILALAQVSDVKAPNVIDTPLGMMDNLVKRSVLKTAIRESSQLILFLTSSEIANCEDILDEKAGQVITLTNPAHYPQMLVNAPQVKKLNVLRCECNHRQECATCMRRRDIEAGT